MGCCQHYTEITDLVLPQSIPEQETSFQDISLPSKESSRGAMTRCHSRKMRLEGSTIKTYLEAAFLCASPSFSRKETTFESFEILKISHLTKNGSFTMKSTLLTQEDIQDKRESFFPPLEFSENDEIQDQELSIK